MPAHDRAKRQVMGVPPASWREKEHGSGYPIRCLPGSLRCLVCPNVTGKHGAVPPHPQRGRAARRTPGAEVFNEFARSYRYDDVVEDGVIFDKVQGDSG